MSPHVLNICIENYRKKKDFIYMYLFTYNMLVLDQWGEVYVARIYSTWKNLNLFALRNHLLQHLKFLLQETFFHYLVMVLDLILLQTINDSFNVEK